MAGKCCPFSGGPIAPAWSGFSDASWKNVVDVHPGFVSKNYTPVGLVGEVTKFKIQETSMFCRMLDFHRQKRKHAVNMRVSASQ